MQFRSDSIGTKLAWEKTPHGYVAFATLAKLGHPLDYVEIEGSRQEYLGSFSEDSLNSIRGMPICLGHPESVTYQGNKSNASVGHFLQEILITDAGELLAPVTVTDQRGIDLIDDCLAKGLSPEISPAYWVESVRQDSRGNFEQCRGRYDHAALLPPGQGRGGKTIALRLDTVGVTLGVTRMTDPINNVASTTTAEAAVSTNALQVELATLKRTVETLTNENAGLKTQLATMGETHLSLDSINAKLTTLAKIGKINLDSVDLQVSATELQKQHIRALRPTLDLTDKNDDYIAGVFESLVGASAAVSAASSQGNHINSDSNVSAAQTAIANAQGQLNGVRSDSSVTNDPIELARQKRLTQIASNSL